MTPTVHRAFEALVSSAFTSPPRAVMEVGASRKTLLDIAMFKNSRRVALNVAFDAKSREKLGEYEIIEASGNSIPLESGSFDCIVSSSTLEHDKEFWKTVAEVERLLMPGGVFIVGIPIYTELPTDMFQSTLTFALHGKRYNADFYRFSEQAVREVLLAGMLPIAETIVRRYPSPYMIASGRKPG
jgi:SAM-dependent methyltransferase